MKQCPVTGKECGITSCTGLDCILRAAAPAPGNPLMVTLDGVTMADQVEGVKLFKEACLVKMPGKESKLPLREPLEVFGDRVKWYRGKPESKLALDTARLLVMQAWARQDDWDRYFVGSDIRLLIGQARAAIELEREIAELKARAKP